jgi:hypothetical protein
VAAVLTQVQAVVVLAVAQQDLTLRRQMQPLTQAVALVVHPIMQALQADLALS